MRQLPKLSLLIFFVSFPLAAQVIIREKVEITPQPPAVVAAGQLEVTLSLSGSLNPNRPGFVRASNFGCGIDVIGGTSVSAPLQAGLYQIVGRFSTAGVVSYALRVKVGSDELLVEQGVAPANVTVNLVPQVEFDSGIKFSLGGPIVQGQRAGYSFIGFVFTFCSTTAVHSLSSTTLSITSGQGLGEFVDETGRLLGGSVTRKLNELGGIGFIANGRPPTGSQEEVGIQATVGGGVIGTASLVVKKQEVKVELDIPTPKEIWATLPQGSGGNPNKRNEKEKVRVKVTKDVAPAAAYDVEIEAKMILPSGGHDHTNQPPMELLGEFKDLRTGKQGKGVLKTTTDDNGEILLDYTAPEFSGTIELTAKSTTENAKDKGTLTVKVPELEPLTASANLMIFTLTEQFHSLANSNYGTATTRDAVYSGVRQYATEYGIPNDIFLSVIDMSLPFGGLFDIDGNWQAPHSSHRIGKSVDFSNFYKDANGENLAVNVFIDGALAETTNKINQRRLDFYFDRLQFNRLEKSVGKIHYESRF